MLTKNDGSQYQWTITIDGSDDSHALDEGPQPNFGWGTKQDATGKTVATSSSASGSGTITETFTWQGPNGKAASTPPPQTVIIAKQCAVSWYSQSSDSAGAVGTGDCNTGLTGFQKKNGTFSPPPYAAGASGAQTEYTTMSGAATLPVTLSPTLSVSGTGVVGPPTGEGTGDLVLTYSVTVTPVTIGLSGVTYDSGGNALVLVGQQIEASLSSVPGLSDPVNYSWSFSGSNFKTYDTTAPNSTNATQLVNLTTQDRSLPLLDFYTKKSESVTVSCQTAFTAPDGTSLPVNIQSAPIKSEKPSVKIWPIAEGWVHYNPNQTSFGLYGDLTTNPPTDGVEWDGVVVVNAPDFPQGGGTCTFTQLVKPDREGYKGNASYPLGENNGALNGILGLDGSFDYGNEWAISGMGEGGDSPTLNPYVNPGYNPQSANDSYTTYIMYEPPSNGLHQVWIPLKKYSWTWSEQLTLQNSIWNITASFPAMAGSAPTYTPQTTTDPPQWTVTQNKP